MHGSDYSLVLVLCASSKRDDYFNVSSTRGVCEERRTTEHEEEGGLYTGRGAHMQRTRYHFGNERSEMRRRMQRILTSFNVGASPVHAESSLLVL